jgi:hypothetical protein
MTNNLELFADATLADTWRPDVDRIVRLAGERPRRGTRKWHDWIRQWAGAWGVSVEGMQKADFVLKHDRQLADAVLRGDVDLATAANVIRYGDSETRALFRQPVQRDGAR